MRRHATWRESWCLPTLPHQHHSCTVTPQAPLVSAKGTQSRSWALTLILCEVQLKRHSAAIPFLEQTVAHDRASGNTEAEAPAHTTHLFCPCSERLPFPPWDSACAHTLILLLLGGWKAAALVALGIAHERNGSHDQLVMDAFHRAVNLNPTAAEPAQFLGLAHMKKADSPCPPAERQEAALNAARYLKQSIELDPSVAEAHCDAASAFRDVNETSLAVAASGQCLRLQRGLPYSEMPHPDQYWTEPSPREEPGRRQEDMAVGATHKLRHDADQLQHLVSLGVLPPRFLEATLHQLSICLTSSRPLPAGE